MSSTSVTRTSKLPGMAFKLAKVGSIDHAEFSTATGHFSSSQWAGLQESLADFAGCVAPELMQVFLTGIESRKKIAEMLESGDFPEENTDAFSEGDLEYGRSYLFRLLGRAQSEDRKKELENSRALMAGWLGSINSDKAAAVATKQDEGAAPEISEVSEVSEVSEAPARSSRMAWVANLASRLTRNRPSGWMP